MLGETLKPAGGWIANAQNNEFMLSSPKTIGRLSVQCPSPSRLCCPVFVYVTECVSHSAVSLLACSVLPSEALPGADDFLGFHPSFRGRPVLLFLVLRLDGIDPTLRRNVYFYLKKAK